MTAPTTILVARHADGVRDAGIAHVWTSTYAGCRLDNCATVELAVDGRHWTCVSWPAAS